MIYVRFIFLGFLLAMTACDSRSRVANEEAGTASMMSAEKVVKIEAGIKSYVDQKAQQDGYFYLRHEDHTLRMTLLRVHTEYLYDLAANRHFACADLADVSGNVYDVDFFLDNEGENVTVTETRVHRLNGKPFYAWKQREDKTWQQVPILGASRALQGVIEGTDLFEFRYHVTLPEITGLAKMWVPIPASDNFQHIELLSLDAPGKYRMLEEKEYGNTILYLELTPAHTGETIDIVYRAERKEKGPFTGEGPVDRKYLKAGRLTPVGGQFKVIADEAIGEKSEASKLVQARALYDYIIDNMRYIKTGDYGHGDAVYACDTRTGNCSEFHSFFISLARSVGIPARFSIGASIPSERNEGGIAGYHCWAEFYADGKWWPVDISEGNKYSALATYYFGRHPANRIELSRGRDLVVTPGPANGPINFLAYPLLEIDGKTAFSQTTFSFTRNLNKSRRLTSRR